MSDLPIIALLLLVPSLPMFLAIPALRRRLPQPLSVALLPALVLLLLPGWPVIEFPWILVSGSAYGVDPVSRVWLGMSIIMWFAAGRLLETGDKEDAGAGHRTSWFLLCQGGQLGALQSTDLVSFFAWVALMGYAFFGLLARDRDPLARRAARTYVVLLVLADVVLFEVLLIALTVTQDLKFTRFATEIAASSSAGIYVSLAALGFALKGALWPAHAWFPQACGPGRPWMGQLLWLVPAATGLLGLMRWLPLGEMSAPLTGLVMQGLGAGAVLYAVLLGMRRVQPIACVIIAAAGLAVAVLGTGLADPVFWEAYATLLPVYIALVGSALAITSLAKNQGVRLTGKESDPLILWFEYWLAVFLGRVRRLGAVTLPRWRAALMARLPPLRKGFAWQGALDAGERALQRWAVALTVFVVLGGLIVLSLVLLHTRQ
jgi:hypothetical protein